MDIEKLKRECGVEERRVPETLREACGLSARRWTRNKDERADNGPITAQRLFAALTRKEAR